MDSKDFHINYINDTYKEVAELGSGREGKTYLAQNVKTGEFVVKKQLSLSNGEVYEKLKSISHPNLPRIYDMCYAQETCIVIQEYVTGETLEQLLEGTDGFLKKQVKTYSKQILGVLELIHKQGIVHRDLKPANILVSTDGVIKILDFGIARNIKADQKKDTRILGTQGYASPEQFGFRQTDQRADIYAFGILLNQMLTGKMPDEQLPKQRAYRIVIEKCMEIDPQKRYKSVKEIQETLGLSGSTIIPGFRGRNILIELLAIICYGSFFNHIMDNLLKCKGSWQAFCMEFAALTLYIEVPYFLLTNFGRWANKIKPFSSMPKIVSIMLRIIISLIFMILGIELEEYMMKMFGIVL